MEKTHYSLIDVGSIHPSPTNPRRRFDEGDLAELADSVRRHGIIQPIVVRPNSDGYEIVAGERRWRAARKAELGQVPAIVRELSDEDVLEIQLIENLQRADVHPLEEAAGYQRLMTAGRYDVARIAEKVGRSTKYIYDRVKLLALIEPAQALFLDGRITAGHAILLARLKPADQERAIDPDGAGRHSALWENEYALFDPALFDPADDEVAASDDETDNPLEGLKTRSVRELQAWIDEHVKFDTESADLPDLFPETASTLKEAREEAEKIIPITHDHYVQPDAKDGQRVFGPRSWKRADGRAGSKACDAAVTGVIVVGPGRGDAFKVCIAKKKCAVHWGAEQREAKKRATAATKSGKTGKDGWEIEQEKRREQEKRDEAARERWAKARPAILAAVAERVKTLPVNSTGPLAEIVLSECFPHHGSVNAKLLPRGTTAEDFVRYAAFVVLVRECEFWRAAQEFPKRAKLLGVDLSKILDQQAPVQTSAKSEAGTGASKKRAATKAAAAKKTGPAKSPKKTRKKK